MTQADIVAASNTAADAAGIPRLLLLACAVAEGNLDPNARRPADPSDDQDYWPDVSGGAWQQTVRWDPDYRGGGAYPGEAEIERVLALQYNPARSARVAAENLAPKWGTYQPDILATLYAYNWPAGGGLPASDAASANYHRGLSEAQSILGANPVPDTALTYNHNQPPERQISSWACSIRTLTWMLKSLGVQTDAGTLQDEMVPTYVTPEVGLLDGRGNGLAAVARSHLPPSAAVNVIWAPAWDDLLALAGRGPIGIGSGSLYHWLDVAAAIDATTVKTANPAPNYPAGAPLGDTLTRDQFNQYAPWALVMVDVSAAPVPVPGPAVVQTGPFAGMTLDQLQAKAEGLLNATAYQADTVGDAMTALVKELQRVRTEQVGPRP